MERTEVYTPDQHALSASVAFRPTPAENYILNEDAHPFPSSFGVSETPPTESGCQA